MIDIFKSNLNEFDINNINCNTIICNANEIENSNVLNALSPIQKNNIHLNVNIYSDKDIETFIYLDQENNYKSINIILNSDFNLSKIACQKLELLVNINSVLFNTKNSKFKGCSFKNYFLSTAINENKDTNLLLSNNALYSLKNFSKKENANIIFSNLNVINTEILDFLKAKNYTQIYINSFNDQKFKFNISTLYTITERINNYTQSININIENITKFNILYKKILKDINYDFENFLKANTLKTENDFYYLYKNLSFYGYSFIMYHSLQNLNIDSNLKLSYLLNSDNEKRYYNQIKLDKHWFNLDIVWNYENQENINILKNDREFFNTHSTECKDTEKCIITYKKFYKKYNLLKFIKNKFILIFNKNKKELLGLPEPNSKIK